jgi:hypothetical protein
MDALTVFGIVTLTVMLILYALEDRSPGYTSSRLRALAFSPRFTAFYREPGLLGFSRSYGPAWLHGAGVQRPGLRDVSGR